MTPTRVNPSPAAATPLVAFNTAGPYVGFDGWWYCGSCTWAGPGCDAGDHAAEHGWCPVCLGDSAALVAALAVAPCAPCDGTGRAPRPAAAAS